MQRWRGRPALNSKEKIHWDQIIPVSGEVLIYYHSGPSSTLHLKWRAPYRQWRMEDKGGMSIKNKKVYKKEILMTIHTKNSNSPAYSFYLRQGTLPMNGKGTEGWVSPDVKEQPSCWTQPVCNFLLNHKNENSSLQKSRPLNFLLTAVSGFFNLLSSWA